MGKKTVRISVTLPAELAAGLDRAAVNAACERHTFLERVFRAYLMRDAPELSLVGLPETVVSMPFALQRQVWVGHQIVTAWHAVVEKARRQAASSDAATQQFVARVRLYQGINLSRGTLYNWSRRLAVGGVVPWLIVVSLKRARSQFKRWLRDL